MDLGFSEEQKMVQKNARAFMNREIVPIVGEYERKYAPLPKDKATELMKKLIPLGYIGGVIPTKFGGAGIDYVTHAILVEELARAWGGLTLMTLVNATVGAMQIWKLGNEEQHARFLKPALAVDKIFAMCLTEPDNGSDLGHLQTRAVLDGDNYIINGTKTWITNGPIADVATVAVLTDPSKGPLGVSQIIVEREVSPWKDSELPKLGFRACPTSELSLEDCRVPRENLLAVEGGGYKAALDLLNFGRGSIGAFATGIAQAAIDAAVEYAKNRYQFGRPIGSFQMMQGILAEITIQTDAARLLTFKARDMLGKGERCLKESSGIKFFATETAVSVTSRAMEIFGSYGISEEYPMERYYRDARCLISPDGTSQVQRLVVGRELLGIDAVT